MDTTTTAPPGLTSTVALGRVLRRHALLIVVVTALAAMLGYAVSSLVATTYSADTRIRLADESSGTVFGSAAPSPFRDGLVVATTALVTSDEVLGRAADQLGDDVTAGEVRDRVRVAAQPDSGSVEVTATADDSDEAVATLGAVTSALDEVMAEENAAWAASVEEQLTPYRDSLLERIQNSEEELEQLQAGGAPRGEVEILVAERAAAYSSLLDLESRMEGLSADTAIVGSGIYRVDDVRAPQSPVRPQGSLAAIVGGLIGFVLSLGYAWRRSERLPLVEDRRDPQAIIGVPMVGELGPANRTGRRGGGRDRRRHAAHLHAWLQRRLLVDAGEREAARLLHVRGIAVGDASARVAVSIGVEAARSGRDVVIAGVRPDDVDTATGATPAVKLLAAQGGSVGHVFHSGDGTVRVVSAARWAEMQRAGERPDLVVVNAGPVVGGAQALGHEPHHAAVVLAIHRNCEVDRLEEAFEILQLEDAELVGYVYLSQPASRSDRRHPHRDEPAERTWTSKVG